MAKGLKKLQALPLFRALSSLKLAVTTILSLAAILAVATVLEAQYGMRAAHLMVYGQPWFYGVLALLGVNVFTAALSRYPWKKNKIGFVITHAGILTLLLGSWLTMEFGIDGNLPVVEGSEDSEVILNDLSLVLSDEVTNLSQSFPVPESALKTEGRLLEVQLNAGDSVVIEKFLPRARVQQEVRRSPVAGIGTPALNVEVFNARFSVGEWLLASQPVGPTEVNLGPAVISLQKLWKSADERKFRSGVSDKKARGGGKGYVLVQYQGRQYRVAVEEGLKQWRAVGTQGLQMRVERYLPYAVVEKNRLVNKSPEPVNPTVQVRLRDGKGIEENHTLFAQFPDFATLHKKAKPEGQAELGARMRLVASTPAAAPPVRGRLLFAQSPDDRVMHYRITGKQGKVLGQGVVVPGKEIPTGWMDLRFKVLEWIPDAVQTQLPKYIEKLPPGESSFPSAIEISHAAEHHWLMEGASVPLSVGNQMLSASFARKRLSLPFQLHLKKFTLGTDPGTTKAATYESEVIVKDPGKTEAPAVRISMNEPLQYGGFTFYQASYQMREGQPPVSVFSVNRDPGRWVKYVGSLVMVFGIVLMFYFNPQYWDLFLGLARSRT